MGGLAAVLCYCQLYFLLITGKAGKSSLRVRRHLFLVRNCFFIPSRFAHNNIHESDFAVAITY